LIGKLLHNRPVGRLVKTDDALRRNRADSACLKEVTLKDGFYKFLVESSLSHGFSRTDHRGAFDRLNGFQPGDDANAA
jgi:hypothetical protein